MTIKQSKRIFKLPKLMCLHLNRLAYNNQGNMFINRRHIQFHEHLELNTDQVSSFQTALKYKLVSIVEHYGTTSFGHYVAAKRIANPIEPEHEGMFLLCNDSKTYPVPVSQVLKSNAFMLFYERE